MLHKYNLTHYQIFCNYIFFKYLIWILNINFLEILLKEEMQINENK